MALCGRGYGSLWRGNNWLSRSDRMTKELVIAAVEDAYRTGGKVSGATIHSDRGSQYCSNAYQEKLKEYGYICSMSWKGNCWDNAPMESFWGKLKQEWLNEHILKTREEAKAKVFEYIMVFYNRKRPHANFDYMTPEEYYNKHENFKYKLATNVPKFLRIIL